MKQGDVATKQQAKVLFMRGYRPSDVISTLHISSATLYRWINTEKWREEKQSYQDRIAQNELQVIFHDEVKRKEKIISDLEFIRNKSIDSIITEKVRPTKFPDAVDAYIDAVKTEKEFKEDLLKSNFINIVIKVLSEEIQDDELFFRIGKRLQSLASSRGSGQSNYLLGPATNTQ